MVLLGIADHPDHSGADSVHLIDRDRGHLVHSMFYRVLVYRMLQQQWIRIGPE
jgi:hypothetical protein